MLGADLIKKNLAAQNLARQVVPQTSQYSGQTISPTSEYTQPIPEQERTMYDDFGEFLSYPRRMVQYGIADILGNAYEGPEQKRWKEYTSKQMVEDLGYKPDEGQSGFYDAVDIMMDPTTYLAGGLVSGLTKKLLGQATGKTLMGTLAKGAVTDYGTGALSGAVQGVEKGYDLNELLENANNTGLGFIAGGVLPRGVLHGLDVGFGPEAEAIRNFHNDQRGIFVGVKSNMSQDMLENLRDAMEMEEQFSKSWEYAKYRPNTKQVRDANETIRQQTGWFLGDDGMWRYEINDRPAQFDQTKIDAAKKKTESMWPSYSVPTKVGKVFNHDELYDLYPQLKNIPLDIYHNTSRPDWGGANAIDNSFMDLNFSAATDPRGSILHELQHAVQNIEGFASGSSPSVVPRRIPVEHSKEAENLFINEFRVLSKNEFIDMMDAVTKRRYANDDEPFASWLILQKNISKLKNVETDVAYSEYKTILEKIKNGTNLDNTELSIKSKIKTWADQASALNLYKKYAGEREARATDNRRDYTDADRQAYRPPSYEDSFYEFRN